VTVTVPEGELMPPLTVKSTSTGCPSTDGDGVCEVMVVVVENRVTVCATPEDVLLLKFASPA
jgi:hypothetical protein